ncbi:l1 transposable element-related [Holotrichia oblita]|uniref:L1 transposable element-related n=1 Tax=Holotrichia oblita TaxID=644536 RepID=A0ACB9T402_HOLOL|nr:l1 transposable element-related [Holotrichia oblita]
MAEYKLRSKQAGSLHDEDLLAEKIVEKLLANNDFIERISARISEHLSPLLDAKVNTLVTEVGQLKTKLEQLEQYTRLNNLRVYGVKEGPNEDVCKLFSDICRDKLNIIIQPSEIDIIHRLKGKEDGVRPIIVRFSSRMTKKRIFASKSRLKGTKMVIKEDLTPQRINLLKHLAKRAPPGTYWTNDCKVFLKSKNKIYQINSVQDINDVWSKQSSIVSKTTSEI